MGTKLVVFEGADEGELYVLNAYCPNMGRNLARGTIEGDTITCPFHDWRSSGNGEDGAPAAWPPQALCRGRGISGR